MNNKKTTQTQTNSVGNEHDRTQNTIHHLYE
jgi:hypothetical protein